MISGKLVRFLEERANVAMAGTRSRNLVPYGHRLSGWRVSNDARTVTAIVSDLFTKHLIESLEDNGEIAMTVEEYPSHETYQLKGRYLRHRPIESEDLPVVERARERLAKSLKRLNPEAPDAMLKAFTFTPCLAVDFEVREIYLQTPGPGAGTRLVPPADV